MAKEKQNETNLKGVPAKDPSTFIGSHLFILGSDSKSEDGNKEYVGAVSISVTPFGKAGAKPEFLKLSYIEMAKTIAFIRQNAEHFNRMLEKEKQQNFDVLGV